jgi:urease accessory protein
MRRLSAFCLAALAASPALAHTGVGAHESAAHGFLHPLLGSDHVLAMVAVGLWAALVGGRALWAWPVAFVGTMLFGAAVAVHGSGVAGVETGVAVSVLVLGLAVATAAKPRVLAGAVLCGAFAFLHGFAHGAELPAGADVAGYMAGFTLATSLLHAAGLGLGAALWRFGRPWTPRLAGGAVALAGAAMLAG